MVIVKCLHELFSVHVKVGNRINLVSTSKHLECIFAVSLTLALYTLFTNVKQRTTERLSDVCVEKNKKGINLGAIFRLQ